MASKSRRGDMIAFSGLSSPCCVCFALESNRHLGLIEGQGRRCGDVTRSADLSDRQ